MKYPFHSAAAAACLCFASVAFAADPESQGPVIDISQVPAPVQATLKAEKGRIDKIQQETEGGKTFYEATVSKEGKNYSLHVSDNGKILKRESLKDEK